MTPWAWMRSRPPAVRALMRTFPDACRVVATIPLHVPAPGRVGRVVGYYEADDHAGLYVEHEDEWMADRPGRVRAQCHAEWLRVIQYDANKTPAWVDRVMAGTDAPFANPGQEGRIEGEGIACGNVAAPCPHPEACRVKCRYERPRGEA